MFGGQVVIGHATVRNVAIFATVFLYSHVTNRDL